MVLCTNTMHRVYDAIRDAVSIPVLHIADGTARPLEQAGYRTVGLLGTRYTMEQEFYKSRLVKRGFDVLIPDEDERDIVHQVIYTELCLGKVLDHSRDAYLEIVGSLATRGAEAVILGCTEIGLLLNKANCPLPVFDTTLLHVEAALDWALDQDHPPASPWAPADEWQAPLDRLDQVLAQRRRLRLRVACPSQEFAAAEMAFGVCRWLSFSRGIWESLTFGTERDLALIMLQAPRLGSGVLDYLFTLLPAQARDSQSRHALIEIDDARDMHLSEKVLASILATRAVAIHVGMRASTGITLKGFRASASSPRMANWQTDSEST